MPELPEVETFARILRLGGRDNPSLVRSKINGELLLWSRTLAFPSYPEFHSHILGQTIQDIGRRGKFLLFTLSSHILIIHLRMSGDLLVEAESAPIGKHYRLVLNLQDGLRLAFNDPRKFGRVWLTADPDTVLGDLGPEPLDESFTAQVLYERLHLYRRQLKPLLLNQTFLAGLGNIYSDEALHMAKLHPSTLSHNLTPDQAERLWHSICTVLREGIRRNGASIDWVYRGGDFQNYFRVYRRTGQPCLVCGTPIQRLVIGQRSTHYCPTCQLFL